MTVYVFLGPTLPREDAARELDAVWLPPVAQGDVARIAERRPTAIGIIDGFFESVPAVWHKEILHALRLGIPVYGASSMGALRAAELHPFGMTGVGAVFEAYRDGRIEDDDEVAVIHGPAELGYTSLSEAMVNIRRTLSDAVADGVVDAALGRLLEGIAKELPYRERGYGRVLRLAGEAGVPATDIARFRAWLPMGRVDQKREDAKDMLRLMRRRLGQGMPIPDARFHFEHTLLWDRVQREAAARPV
ncbi:tfuA protein [Azospirillum sp. RWY-5-1]|uniref:TfuA protein n=1 Tax=Azospirillum oleiclasticum TaxID=2735135 RepID=A0ABX2TMI6_9PROT|nr:TfuA-like protein [Azospirillum oleiclasticum]NYZ16984.1 tfuA protein [Azospirillum oleiclasticum]NYZ24573.1 tfuA protein [Azospirillum oleiclasticum]